MQSPPLPTTGQASVVSASAERGRRSSGGQSATHRGPLGVGQIRICLITETMITGVGRHVTDLAKAMAARGHEVHVLHSTSRTEARLLRELAGLPRIDCRAWPMRREPHGSDFGNLMALARHLRRHGPFDVVHGHSAKGGVYARLLARVHGGRCLYSPHGFVTLDPNLTPLRRALYSAVERGLGLATDDLICLTTEERQHARDLGLAARRLRIVPNGLDGFDTSLGDARRRQLGLSHDQVVIGFIGRMDNQKAPDRLIQASRTLLTQDPRIHVVMVGDGPLRADLEAETRGLGLEGRFTWCGDVPARAWITSFDILAMPSVYEGFSYVVLEALYAGVPIVCTPVGGVADAIEDGVQGFIVPHDDPARLTERLARLAADPGLREEMGRRCRERATMFSWQRSVDLLEALYASGLEVGTLARAGSSGA